MEQAQESPDTTTATRPWLKHYDQGVPQSIGYLKTPLFCFLEEAAQRYPNRPAIHFFGHHITYRELDHWSNRFGNALLKLGVQRGDRVAIMLPNCPQMV
ncbi:MAG: AMP-binding protein, partial [Chloroflexi bacterium]|nr:AMP-binding protein [Chloroflexota bacterium]